MLSNTATPITAASMFDRAEALADLARGFIAQADEAEEFDQWVALYELADRAWQKLTIVEASIACHECDGDDLEIHEVEGEEFVRCNGCGAVD